MKASQKEKGKKIERNDRVIAVAVESIDHSTLKHVKEVNKNLMNELIHFFEYYNKMRNKKFNFLGLDGPDKAIRIIKKHKQK